MEHRWGNRVPAALDVRIFADPASAGWGRLRDISVSGGFVETALSISVLSTLQLTLPMRQREELRIVRGIVVRSATDGVGVEWFDGHVEIVTCLIREIARRIPPAPRFGPFTRITEKSSCNAFGEYS